MKKYSILMLVSTYHQVSGHTRVIDSLSQELVHLGHQVTIGAFSFEKDPPTETKKLILQKSNITQMIKEGSFDILHNHQTFMNYRLLFTKQPLIFHYHGVSTQLQRMNLRVCSIICKKRIHKIISVSESAKKDIQQYFTTSNVLIYNGVNTNVYRANPEQKISKGTPQLLFVGNLFEYKNVQFLIKSFPQLQQKFPNVHLQIIGDGLYRNTLAEIISSLQLQDHIEFIGTLVEEEQLQRYYNSCDVYVTASTKEVFNLPLLESMSCAKPVLASALPVHQQIISQSSAGKVFTMNVDSFVQGLELILENYTELSHYARKFALEYDWANMAKRTLTIYEELSQMYSSSTFS